MLIHVRPNPAWYLEGTRVRSFLAEETTILLKFFRRFHIFAGICKEGAEFSATSFCVIRVSRFSGRFTGWTS